MLRRRLALASLGVVLAAAGCRAPDPRQDFELSALETYWAVDAPRGDTQYIAPVVRFRLRNRARRPARSVQAQAVFHRAGEEGQAWGGDFKELSPSRQPLAPGAELFVELISDGHYYTTGTPESMLTHALFKDAKVEVFLREGSSLWTKMAEAGVERRIGAKGATIPGVPASPRS